MNLNMIFSSKTRVVTLSVCFVLLILEIVNSRGETCGRRSSCASCTDNNSECDWCQPMHAAQDGFCGSPSKINQKCDGEITRGGNYFKEEASVKCNFLGTYECGRCNCHEGYYGEHCECDASSVSENSCRMSPESVVCEGRGVCVCGMCYCDLIHPHTTQRYTGQFCECNDYSCDYYNNRQCGGPARGICSCGQCMCSPGYTGPACECALSEEGCIASNGQVCNNRGQCQCGHCICDGYAQGPTCEDIP